MKFLFVIDPLENLNKETDSTVEMMREASRQGIGIYYCETGHIYFDGKKVYAHSSLLKVRNGKFEKIRTAAKDLDFYDLILMRKEPPYDLNYHYATMLLEKTKTKVLNSPDGLRTANEKLVILNFPKLIPPTIVTKEENRIKGFVRKNGKCVIKPIHLYGGKCVEIISKTDKDLGKRISKVIKKGRDYAIVQKFMERVVRGDKRIILLNGKPLGAIIRVPKKGDFRANMVIGGTPKKYKLTRGDRKIISMIRPYLVKHGLLLAGVDVIGNKLIEINVTCPTGIVQLKQLDRKNITKDIINLFVKEARSSR